MKNVLEKSCGENHNTVLSPKMFTQNSYRLWNYVINTKCIVEFPLQQWLIKHATVLGYTYIA
jgi:hypothetical protein